MDYSGVSFFIRDRPVNIPWPSRQHPVTVSSSSRYRPVPRRSKSSNVLKRRTYNASGRLRTLKDVGRFRTPKDGTLTGWLRDGDGTVTVTEQKSWLRCFFKNSTVFERFPRFFVLKLIFIEDSISHVAIAELKTLEIPYAFRNAKLSVNISSLSKNFPGCIDKNWQASKLYILI